MLDAMTETRVAAPVRRNHEVAAFEVEMARRLEEADCPIAVLDPRVDPLVHVRDGFAITYWKYYEPLPAADTTLAEYAQTLERLHAGMRQLDAPAPHFTERVEEAQSIVRDRSQSPELIDADRELLANSLRSLRRAVVDRGADEQLLHGEPHAGNLLRTTSGMRFIDLETCCYGPVEFDIAHEDGSFFTKLAVDLRVTDADRSYHVPLLLAPYSMTTYRGS